MVSKAPSVFILAAVYVLIPLKVFGHFSNSRGLLSSDSRPNVSPENQISQTVPHFARNLMEETAETSHAFKILVDFSLSDPIPDTTLRFIQKYVFEPVITMYDQMVKVNATGILPAFSQIECVKDKAIPEMYKDGGVAGDLVIFVLLKQMNPTINAISDSCGLDPKNHRPVIGQITLNLSLITPNYVFIETLKSTIIHEINHILAFDIFLFDYFKSGASPIYEKQLVAESQENILYFQIKIPQIIEYSKNFFDCPTIESLPMEDEGSISSRNSHFDKRIAGNEMMTAQREGRQVMSMFTLIFLASTGWYDVDFSFAEYFVYGRKKGCPIQKITEDKSLSVYSSSDKNKCSDLFMGKTECVRTVFNSNQPQQIPLRKYRCSNTQNFVQTSPFEVQSSISRCFETEFDNENSAGCYPVICTGDVPSVLVEDKVYVCKDAIDVIIHKGLTLKCSNFDRVCKKPICENDCNGNGVCLENATCKCFTFFTGSSCQYYSGCEQADLLCQMVTPSNTNTWQNNLELISRFQAVLSASSNSTNTTVISVSKDLEIVNNSSAQNNTSKASTQTTTESQANSPHISANSGSVTPSPPAQNTSDKSPLNNKLSQTSPIKQITEPQSNSQTSSISSSTKNPASSANPTLSVNLSPTQGPASSNNGNIQPGSDSSQNPRGETNPVDRSAEEVTSKTTEGKVDLNIRDSETKSVDSENHPQEFSAYFILKPSFFGFLITLFL